MTAGKISEDLKKTQTFHRSLIATRKHDERSEGPACNRDALLLSATRTPVIGVYSRSILKSQTMVKLFIPSLGRQTVSFSYGP